MKRIVYIILISFVTVVCIIIGCLSHLSFRGSDLGLPIIGHFGTGASWGEMVSGEETLDHFDKISMEVSVADLTLKTGDAFHISYKCREKLLPEYRVENNTLILSQKTKKLNWKNSKGCKLTVTVPRDVSLQEASLICDIGDVDVTGVQTDRLHVACAVGDLDVENASVGQAELTMGVGDLDMEDVLFQDLTVETDIGDVDIDGVRDLNSYGMDIAADIGSVEINDTNYKHSYHQEGTNGYQIRVKADLGGIDINGE